ncbi:Oxoglutarate/iron-dependent dioxygenase [Corchorus olitorius]|uniref:Oxoglutarate/iron-dependent dioxygenase n=1 Tax=Corchorus olitorius TaxID=93759 RepID=A0A1R3K113_9ROSI|nr:Oxoglutarate/iron-dependent dioxygenase [Corchorus olitorius]
MGVPHVPQRYVLPPSQRPNPTLDLTTTLPIVDLSSLHNASQRSQTLDNIQSACKELGFFQVVNHGIPLAVMNDALDAATEFFNLSLEEKMLLLSANVNAPVRYGTSLNHANDKVHFWRDFIKHYAHPISNWIHLWPSNPPSYKDKMGKYAQAVQVLQKQLTEVMLETLGLNIGHLHEEVEEGCQLMAINCYPACPEPDLTLGMPPHSDYGTVTILLQSGPGLQIMDNNRNWHSVPFVEGALIVQLGDQIEVMSNGLYKSVVHQVTLSAENKRLSIASLHSLPLNKKIQPAPELVDEQHPVSYNEFSFRDFLDFISNNNIADRRFIDSIKKTA